MTDGDKSREAIKPSPNTPSVEGDRLATLRWRDLLFLRQLADKVFAEHRSDQEAAALHAADRALAALPCKGGEGWKLVPVEPTEAMVEAHFLAHAQAETVFADIGTIWAAMLAAAPSTEPDTGRGLREALEKADRLLTSLFDRLMSEGTAYSELTLARSLVKAAKADAEVDRIMAMTDDELLAEARANGEDPEQIAAEMRSTLDQALAALSDTHETPEKQA